MYKPGKNMVGLAELINLSFHQFKDFVDLYNTLNAIRLRSNFRFD